MADLNDLKDQIRQQLNLCDTTETPTVCGMKETREGYKKLENLITLKVMYGPNPSIADAIVEIENEFDPNSAE